MPGLQEPPEVSEDEAHLVCGARTYTVIEDHPVEKERRTNILEHHKWKKNFVIETRFISDRKLSDQPRVRASVIYAYLSLANSCNG